MNWRNRKAMVIGQVFIFMIAAVTFALVMIFGYQAISDMIRKGEQVEFYSFKTELEGSIKGMYTKHGSVKIGKFSLPGSYTQICLVDLDKEPDLELAEDDLVAYNVWMTTWEQGGGWDKADQNVFLKPLKGEEEPIKVYKIEIDEGYVCEKIVKGRFRLRLEGLGDRTNVTLAPKE